MDHNSRRPYWSRESRQRRDDPNQQEHWFQAQWVTTATARTGRHLVSTKPHPRLGAPLRINLTQLNNSSLAPHTIQVSSHSLGRWSASFKAKSQRKTLSIEQIHGILQHLHFWNAKLHTAWIQAPAAASARKQFQVTALVQSHHQQQSTRSRQGVFLATGETNPAPSLRFLLLMAGIEPNPGPPRKLDSIPPCETSHGTIKKGVLRFRCAALGCEKACHLKPDCSFITRGAAMKKNWHCTEHGTPLIS